MLVHGLQCAVVFLNKVSSHGVIGLLGGIRIRKLAKKNKGTHYLKAFKGKLKEHIRTN